MAYYEYLTEDNETIKVQPKIVDGITDIDPDDTITLKDGRVAHRVLQGPKQRATGVRDGSGYPMVSDAMGCHPSQVGEFNRFVKERGIKGVLYNPNGTVTIDDKKPRRELGNALGIYDRNAGFSDPTPQNR